MAQQWMKVAELYWLDPKFNKLGTTHEALYMRLLGYSRHFATGGFIPANAIAYCGRKIYNRDKVLADLVKAGLIEECSAEDTPYVFPKSWHKYSTSPAQDKYKPQVSGPPRAGAEKKEREIDKDLDLSINETQAQAREDDRSDSDKRWAEILKDLQGNKPVLIDGQLCSRVDGEWVPINGS